MVVALETRELAVTYGSYSVGGDNTGRNCNRDIDGGITVVEGYTEDVVEFDFVLYGAESESEFVTECSAAVSAFSKDRQALTLTQGATTARTWSHASNTGFNARADIGVTAEDPHGSGRSRGYHVRITIQKPPSLDVSGRRSASVRVDYDTARVRTVTISGVYTALSSNSARAQYAAAIASYCSDVLTALTGTYESVPEAEQFEFDDASTSSTVDGGGKICSFTRVYRELIASQGGSNLDDSAIVRQSLVIMQASPAPGDSPQAINAQRPDEASASFTATLDKTVSTDLTGKWTGTYKAWVLGRIRTIVGGVIALENQNVSYDIEGNTIRADMRVTAVRVSGTLRYARTETLQIDQSPGVAPITHKNPLAAYVYDAPWVARQTVTIEVEAFGHQPLSAELLGIAPGDFGGFPPAIPEIGPLAGAKRVRESIGAPSYRIERRGRDGYFYDVTIASITASWRLYHEVAGHQKQTYTETETTIVGV